MKIKLEIKKQNDRFDIYINNMRVDYFRPHYSTIELSTLDWLNKLLKITLNKKDLETYLIKNYLEKEKDIEQITNEEFADYLIENFNCLKIYNCLKTYKCYVKYRDEIIYCIDDDNINWFVWHAGILKNKFNYCYFDGEGRKESKGHRKIFMNTIKQTIEHLESFEIKEIGN